MKVKANGIAMNYQVDGPEGCALAHLQQFARDQSDHVGRPGARAQRAYRVLRYDQRGHGGTEATAGRYSFDLLLADVIALMDALAIKKAHFAGLSMGGATALGQRRVREAVAPGGRLSAAVPTLVVAQHAIRVLELARVVVPHGQRADS